jgi:hypothetical protein
MDWNRFKDDPYWMKIVTLLQDRATMVISEIVQQDKTVTLLDLRVLQQELKDIQFFLTIPDLFINEPDKELDSELATDS